MARKRLRHNTLQVDRIGSLYLPSETYFSICRGRTVKFLHVTQASRIDYTSLWRRLDPSSVPIARNFQRSVKIASLFAWREKAACETRSEEIGDKDRGDDAISIRTLWIVGTEKAIRAASTVYCDSFDIFLANMRLCIVWNFSHCDPTLWRDDVPPVSFGYWPYRVSLCHFDSLGLRYRVNWFWVTNLLSSV